MHFTSEKNLDASTTEREFRLGGISGILWMPSAASSAAPVPLIAMGQPGGIGIQQMYARLAARARSAAAGGFASIAIELPGAGDRTPLPGGERARADLRRAVSAGVPPEERVIDQLILPLVDEAVPEWRIALDKALELPEIGKRGGFSGGLTAIGVRRAVVDPRLAAAGLFAGSYVPRTTIEEARRVTIPLHVLLQWDDEGNDRGMALDLFDAFGSKEKTLNANMGGHTGVPAFAGDEVLRFFTRHLGPLAPTSG